MRPDARKGISKSFVSWEVFEIKMSLTHRPARRQFMRPIELIAEAASHIEEEEQASVLEDTSKPWKDIDQINTMRMPALSTAILSRTSTPDASTISQIPASEPYRVPQTVSSGLFTIPQRPALGTSPAQQTICVDMAMSVSTPLADALTPPSTPYPNMLKSPTQSLSETATPSLAKKQQKPRRKQVGIAFATLSILTVLVVVFMIQGNGTTGAWLADTLRATIGPTATAQIESWYLNLTNTTTQLQYQLGNKQVNSPWATASMTPTATPTPPPKATVSPMTLTPIQPLISPALPSEGTWMTLNNAPAPYNYLPLDARSFIRPDPMQPYAIVTLLQFDMRFSHLHVVGGTFEPGGPRAVYGPGVIPQADRQGNHLLAAFNGGFKYADGKYGLLADDGKLYVPPQSGAATIAVTKQGKLILGAWDVDPLLNSQNKDIVAWRQNAALLIDKGMINPLTKDGAAWGGTILNSAYTWRSGIGITAQGSLIYAAGNALTAETLGKAMSAAGVVMAMQTDINPFWVRAFLYDRVGNGLPTIAKLHPLMQGTGSEYLTGTQRDFFYLTRFAPAVPPT